MNDDQLLGKVGSWLEDTDTAQPDVERITARAMDQVPQVRQRGRWWPLPVFDRWSQPGSATSSPVFSALKLVAAGLIVGVFGGILLAGLLAPREGALEPAAVTEPPSPMTTERLRSVATTIDAEMGVLQVIHDGVRDIGSADSLGLVAGRDGGIWLLSDDRFVRIGSEGTHAWPPGHAESANDFGVGPGGTVWTVGVDEDGLSTIESLAGEGWTPAGPASDVRAIEIGADGTVWAMWQVPESDTVAVGYLSGDERVLVGEWPVGELYDGDLYLSETGEPWVIGAPQYRVGKPTLHRLVGGELRLEAHEDTVVAADVGSDGTAWAMSVNELVRLDGVEVEQWALPDDITVGWADAPGWTLLPGDAFRVAPDGTVWFALRAESGPPRSEQHCAGVAGFDGTNWSGPYLSDRCVDSIELAADGSVWVLARSGVGDDDLLDLYVVTPPAAGQ
jgi:hypothetical protein